MWCEKHQTWQGFFNILWRQISNRSVGPPKIPKNYKTLQNLSKHYKTLENDKTRIFLPPPPFMQHWNIVEKNKNTKRCIEAVAFTTGQARIVKKGLLISLHEIRWLKVGKKEKERRRKSIFSNKVIFVKKRGSVRIFVFGRLLAQVTCSTYFWYKKNCARNFWLHKVKLKISLNR